MSHVITIKVLAYSDLYAYIFNFIAAFVNGGTFATLLKISTVASIVMLISQFVKKHDPLDFVKWVLGFVLVTYVLILPKTTVLIQEASLKSSRTVDNVPLIFALGTSLITNIGAGLAESFDENFSLADDLQYTKTGMLFGSELIMASTDFHVTNPVLKEELNNYFRSCVVGDIRLNHKFSMGDLKDSTDIWETMTQNPSPLRMTVVNGKAVTCMEASKKEGGYSLYEKLTAEIKKSYQIFGVTLFGKPDKTTYESLFEKHLTSSFNYYQNMSDTSANIFLQSMMINHIQSGISSYQAHTDSSAGVLNHQFTKTQSQHRWGWQIAGMKAAWFLPILHTVLMLLLFGIFPILLALGLLPSGSQLLKGYVQFLFSLQMWPLMFAILNLVMTFYGQKISAGYGAITINNLDRIDNLHSDLSGVAGYLMLSIPFIANGLVGRLSEAFNGLATSMTGHMQNSAMVAASDATNASFSLGQTSFNNSSANNISMNKHDKNWSDIEGMYTKQLDSGVLRKLTSGGDEIYDTSPGMSKLPVGIADNHALSASLSRAYDESMQAAQNEGQHFQKAISSFAHKALQFSSMTGHDSRLGEGVSHTTSSQIQTSLTSMDHIATDVASKLGISKEAAYVKLLSYSTQAKGGLSYNALGFKAEVEADLKSDSTNSTSQRYSIDNSGTLSAREAQDFNNALSSFSQATQNQHFDETSSSGASLVNQMGADLRNSLNASHNIDASLSQSRRISEAKNFVDTHGQQVSTDLSQAFESYLSHHVDSNSRENMLGHPGNIEALSSLRSYGEQFLSQNQDALIDTYAHSAESKVRDFYQQSEGNVLNQTNHVEGHYIRSSKAINATPEASIMKYLPVNYQSVTDGFRSNITNAIQSSQHNIKNGGDNVDKSLKNLSQRVNESK